MKEDVVKFVLERYLSEDLIDTIMKDIKDAERAGDSDDVDG